jgi:hypothetical protein
MLDRQSLQPEYRAWRNGTDLAVDESVDATPEEAALMPPQEQCEFYKRMRRRVLSFALMTRIAIDEMVEDSNTLADIQYAMIGLREWYYGRPKLH